MYHTFSKRNEKMYATIEIAFEDIITMKQVEALNKADIMVREQEFYDSITENRDALADNLFDQILKQVQLSKQEKQMIKEETSDLEEQAVI